MNRKNDGGYEPDPDEFDESQEAAELDDETVVVPVPMPVHGHEVDHEDADKTIAVPINLDDHTVVVPQRRTDEPVQTPGESAHETGARGEDTSGLAGDPVVIAGNEVSPSLAKLLFKKPLDPKRRAPESPFPKSQSSLPRGGVRAGIPVVYGANSEEHASQSKGTDFARWIGPPPMGYELPTADREALPSSALANRRFRVIALAGGAVVVAVSATGLWWVVTQLFT